MIQKTSGNTAGGRDIYKTILIRYLAISAFCAVFSIVYDQFSHDVRSPWMTWLFVWPLVMGAIPAVLEYFGILPGTGEVFEGKEEIGGIQKDVYRFGIAALTCASLLRGVLKIAGTDSRLVGYLFAAGALMSAAGAVSYFAAVRKEAGGEIEKDFPEESESPENPGMDACESGEAHSRAGREQ